VEAEFRQLDGVTATAAGYAGGSSEAPTYEDVCRGTSGHSEVVQVEFNPAQASYAQLLEVFFRTHNPCSKKKAQYQSVIFTYDAEQEHAAHAAIAELERKQGSEVATAVVPAEKFWRAEEYHQQYYEKMGLGPRHAAVGRL
jgi:peptide-methionine (S)-S-oxide reductase